VLHPTRRRLLLICAISVLWIAAVLLADRGAGIWTQRTLGAFTWLLLLALLRGESRSVRYQVGAVIVAATMLEYTASTPTGCTTCPASSRPAMASSTWPR
jgi:hypothetical protein